MKLKTYIDLTLRHIRSIYILSNYFLAIFCIYLGQVIHKVSRYALVGKLRYYSRSLRHAPLGALAIVISIIFIISIYFIKSDAIGYLEHYFIIEIKRVAFYLERYLYYFCDLTNIIIKIIVKFIYYFIIEPYFNLFFLQRDVSCSFKHIEISLDILCQMSEDEIKNNLFRLKELKEQLINIKGEAPELYNGLVELRRKFIKHYEDINKLISSLTQTQQEIPENLETKLKESERYLHRLDKTFEKTKDPFNLICKKINKYNEICNQYSQKIDKGENISLNTQYKNVFEKAYNDLLSKKNYYKDNGYESNSDYEE